MMINDNMWRSWYANRRQSRRTTAPAAPCRAASAAPGTGRTCATEQAGREGRGQGPAGKGDGKQQGESSLPAGIGLATRTRTSIHLNRWKMRPQSPGRPTGTSEETGPDLGRTVLQYFQASRGSAGSGRRPAMSRFRADFRPLSVLAWPTGCFQALLPQR